MTTLTLRSIARVAYQAGFKGDALVTATAIAFAESSGRVEVVNSIGCVGLWQINQPVHVAAHPKWTRAWLQNAANNAAAAYELSNGGTRWSPWSVYTSGAYKKHLPAARTAAAAITSSDATVRNSGAGSASDDPPGKAFNPYDQTPDPKRPKRPPKAEDEPDPRIRLGHIKIHGGELIAHVRDLVTSATLDWSTSEVTQLTVVMADPGFAVYKRALFEKGSALLYREPGALDLNMRITALTLGPGPAGTGGITIQARSEGVWKLRRRRGPLVMKKVSPSQFVEAECKAVGVKAVVQPSPQRGQVARDVPQGGEADLAGAARPSSWTTFTRLASELGYVVFEFADTVYFGKPTWLADRDKTPLQVAVPLDGAPEVWTCRTIPTIAVSDDAEYPVDISGVEIEKSRFKDCRPGGGMQLRGLPPFKDTYLITSMSMPLLGNGPLTLSAVTPKNPEPQPPSPPPTKRSDDGDGTYDDGSGPVSQPGGKTAASFVNMAVSASSARYVYGAEALSSNPKPAALDCSELVQWALGRIGVPFTDGSAAQIAATNRISVEQGLRTRGALLYKVGHIGISMGDGRSVEARNPTAGVGIFRAADIAWTAAGLVPGLRYG